jgi:hypothetical protein
VASGDSAELFEFGEDVLDQMARLVEVAVERAIDPSVGPWRNHRALARFCQRLDDPGVGQTTENKELVSRDCGSSTMANFRLGTLVACLGARRRMRRMPGVRQATRTTRVAILGFAAANLGYRPRLSYQGSSDRF